MFSQFYRLFVSCGMILGICTACGCHQIPNQQSYWGNGGEYQMKDEMIRRQWQKAAVGGEEVSENYPAVTQSKSRFESFKQFFAKSKTSRLPESLNDDERFYPLDQLSADSILPKHTDAGEIAQNSTAPHNGASSNAARRGKVVPIKKADSSTEETAVQPAESSEALAMSGKFAEKTADKTAADKTIADKTSEKTAGPAAEKTDASTAVAAVETPAAETAAEPKASTVSAQPIAVSAVSPISAELSDCLTGISLCQWDSQNESLASPVPFFEQAALPVQGAVQTLDSALVSRAGENTASPSNSVRQQTAREIILASPLAFLAAPSSAADPQETNVSAHKPADNVNNIAANPANAPVSVSANNTVNNTANKNNTAAVPANTGSLDSLQYSFAVPLNPASLADFTGNPVKNSISSPVNEAETVQPVHFEAQAGQIPSAAAPVSAVPNELYSFTDAASGIDWKAEVRKAVDSLKKEIQRQSAEGTITPAETARLQLLLLATGDSFDSIDSIVTESPSLAAFWEKQCKGLRPLLEEANAENLNRASEELSASLETLKSNCPVIIKKSLFTEAPASFGRYRLHTTGYQPKDTAHVYVELDNIITQKLGDQYGISVLCRWEIFNASGELAARPLEQACSSQSASPMKDIVLNIPAVIPATLPAGKYRLHITVQDQNAAKIAKAESNLNLDVR